MKFDEAFKGAYRRSAFDRRAFARTSSQLNLRELPKRIFRIASLAFILELALSQFRDGFDM